MKPRQWVSVALALLLVLCLAQGSFAASSAAKVSTSDELRQAVENARTARVELTDNIEMEAGSDLALADMSALSIDGKGYELTANASFQIDSKDRLTRLELSDLVIAAGLTDWSGPFIHVESSGKPSDISLARVVYTGGEMIAAGVGAVTLMDSTLTFSGESSASAARLIAADKVVLEGTTNIHEDNAPSENAVLLDVEGSLRLANHSDTEIRVGAKALDAWASDEAGIVLLREGAEFVLGEIDSFAIVYESDELCTYVPEDEDDAAGHNCSDEEYQCCLNVLMPMLGDNRVSAAGGYAGKYEIEITYWDGDMDTFSKLSALTNDRLKGATELRIRYSAPETITVSGKLSWSDEKNAYDTRPGSVTLVLYADGEKTGDTLKAKSGEFSFGQMPYLDENGNRIQYTVRLKNSLKPVYKTSYDDAAHKISNSLVRYTFEGEHKWLNDEGLESGRAKKMTINYKRSDGETGSFSIKTDKTKKKFEHDSDLNKYDADGNLYTYSFSVADKSRVAGYDHAITVDKKGKIAVESKLRQVTVTYYQLLYADGVQTEGNGTPVGMEPGDPVRVDTVRYGESYAYTVPIEVLDAAQAPHALFKMEADNPELILDMGMLADPAATLDPPTVKAGGVSMNSIVYLKYSAAMVEPK